MDEQYRPAGTEIVFAAETGYENGDGTRTEYSGQVYGSSTKYERIDWKANDPIKIAYVHGSSSIARYQVTTVNSPSQENSYADVEATSTKLTWTAGSGNHVFYAMYPANSYGSLSNNNHVEGLIPDSQPVSASKKLTPSTGVDAGIVKYQPDTEQYGYMVAYKSVASGSTENRVRLPFRPAVTTFEFRFQRQSGDLDRKVASFVISTESGANGSDLAGNFALDITGEYQNPSGIVRGGLWNSVTTPTGGSRQRSITVDFLSATNNVGASIPTTGYLDFSVLALPIDQKGITLTINYVGGGSKHITLKDNKGQSNESWHTFTGAKKYVITNTTTPGTEVWHYEIDEIDDITLYGHMPVSSIGYNVKSYKWSERTGQSVKYPVAWKTQYSLYNASNDTWSTWADVPSTGVIPSTDYSIPSSGIEGDGVDQTDYAVGEPRVTNLAHEAPGDGTGTNTAESIKAKMRNTTPYRSGPWDLSMHDIYGNSHLQTTANSYVVDRPGTYKFPLVYGNGITHGDINWEAFWPGVNDPSSNAVSDLHSITDNYITNGTMGDGKDHVRYLSAFRDAAGLTIGNPNIKTSYSNWRAVWGSGMIPSSLNAVIVWQNSMTGDEIVKESTVHLDSGENNIEFTVAPEDIQPGNVIIALTGSVSNGGTVNLPVGTILWSWQIWVTEKDLHPVNVTNSSNVTVGMMPTNLGTIDESGSGLTKYRDRMIKYRIIQTEGQGGVYKYEDFLVEQIGESIKVEANLGCNPYYQWGRKDPLIPADRGAVDSNTGLFKDIVTVKCGSHYQGIFSSTGMGGDGNSDRVFTVNGTWSPNPASGTGIAAPSSDLNYYTESVDYKNGIQYPYKHFVNPISTGWIGGPICFWDYGPSLNLGFGYYTYGNPGHRGISCIPYNLWNSAIYQTMDSGGSDKWKTIYDPCPPGFCVPNLNVYTGLVFLRADRVKKGNFYSDGNGGEVFFPYTGLRVFYNPTGGQRPGVYSLEAEQVTSIGFLWTDCPFQIKNVGTGGQTDYVPFYSKALSFDDSGVTYPPSTAFDRGHNDYTKGSCMPIRPMVDPNPKYR